MSVKTGWHHGVLDELRDRWMYTSDFEEFNKRVEIPVLIYDDYKLGCWNGQFFQEGCNYYGEGITNGQEFVMKRTGGDQCLVFDNQKEEPKGKIKGDVFGISPQHLIVLDKHMENTIKTYRREVLVMLEDQDMDTSKWQPCYRGRPYVKCLMYVHNFLWYSKRPVHTSVVGKSARKPPDGVDAKDAIFAYEFKEARRFPNSPTRNYPHGWPGWPDDNDEQYPLGIGAM